MCFHALQDLIFLVVTLFFQFWIADNTTTDNQFISSIIRPNNEQIFTEVLRNLLCNLGHCQLLVQHFSSVQFKTKQPWRLIVNCFFNLFIRNSKVSFDSIVILFNNCASWIWIVENFSSRSDILQRRVLDRRLHNLGFLNI